MNNQTQPTCIILNHVDKFFGTKQVLNDINIEIHRGEIYGLLGPSGCGKTTTVKLIAGISEATNGSVNVLDTEMPNLKLMNRIGYMAQSDALYPSLSARENLEFFGRIYGMKGTALTEKIAEVMRIVNLTGDMEKAVGAYSGGMKRRLSLAISLLHSPEILVLDEPTVGIDPLLRSSIWDDLRKIASQGVAILVTTHVMDEAEKCTQLSMMRDGLLLATGSPEEIINTAVKLSGNPDTKSIEDAFIYFAATGAVAGETAPLPQAFPEGADVALLDEQAFPEVADVASHDKQAFPEVTDVASHDEQAFPDEEGGDIHEN